jgi:Tol biopolymer transport system component/predicted Ser/Thr protein kinase
MTLTAGTRLGPYRIEAPLGAGGMGEVYKATDTRLDRLVAIKVLPEAFSSDSQFRQRFEREARAISSLSHPHICTLHDVGNQDGVEFLVMEYLDGETLADRLKRGPLPVDQAVSRAAEIANALDKAHSCGIVHRDLKPGNVMLTKTGAKLLDFGLARTDAARGLGAMETRARTAPAPVGERAPLTEQGAILGTFQYMAPEQLEGRPADARTDIWAFGCTLYEMVTARRAFEATSQASLMAAILERDPPPLSTVRSPALSTLDHIVRRCLAKAPDDRWQSAADIDHELAWIAERGSEPAAVVTDVAAFPQAQRRVRAAWSVAAVATLVALAATAIAVLISRHEGLPPPMRFTLGLPAAIGRAAYLALSPDGRSLALAGSNPAGSGTILWVRAMDALDPRPLAGTEGVKQHPFWSADGRSIGFFAQQKLKRVDVSSGVVQVICDAPAARGGTWNRDGTIVFAPDSTSPLFRVDAGGASAPTALTQLGTSPSEQSHRFPNFLADGRHFVFTAWRASGRSVIRLGSLDSPTTTELVTGPSSETTGPADTANTSQAYVSGGYLLFVRAGALLAQPFDQSRWRLTGEATPVVPRVDVDDNNGRQAFTVSENGLLVYRSPAAPTVVQLTWLTRSGVRQNSLWEPGQLLNLSLSPDGRRVATSRLDVQTNSADIWVIDLDRGAASPLTRGRNADAALWSPDGLRIIFDITHGITIADIYSKAADGNGPEEFLLDSPGVSRIPMGWYPDGRLLFGASDMKRMYDIWAVPMIGDRRPVLLMKNDTGASFNPGAFSPDARWIAYQSGGEVYLQSFPSGPRVQVTTSGGSEPYWNSDGRELYYRSQGKLMAVELRRGATIEVGTPKPLFALPPDAGPWVPAGDGQRFLVAMPTGATAPPAPLTVVVNWPGSLGR